MYIHNHLCVLPHGYAASGGCGDKDGWVGRTAPRNQDLETQLGRIEGYRILIEGFYRDLGCHCLPFAAGNGLFLEIHPCNIVLGDVGQFVGYTKYQQNSSETETSWSDIMLLVL